MLAYRASNDEMDPKQAERAGPLLRRLERLRGAEDPLAAGLLSAGLLHFLAGDREEAMRLTERAQQMLSDVEHIRVARSNLKQMRGAG